MANCLTIGNCIAKNCRNAVPGISKIYLANFGDIDTITINGTTDEVSAITMHTGATQCFYSVEVPRENLSITDDLVINVPNGTAIFKPKVEFSIPKIDEDTLNIFNALSQATVMVIATGLDSVNYLLGATNGLDLETGSLASGKASGDFQGFMGALTGLEPHSLRVINSAVTISTLLCNC